MSKLNTKRKCPNCGTIIKAIFPDSRYKSKTETYHDLLVSVINRTITIEKSFRMYECPKCGLLTWWREDKI